MVEVVKYLKRQKAAGPDGIMNEMLMYGGRRGGGALGGGDVADDE